MHQRNHLMSYFLSDQLLGFIRGTSKVAQLFNSIEQMTAYLEICGQINVLFADSEKS